MFSESILMITMYHLICFTPFVPDAEVRFRLGYSVCAFLSFHLAVSLGLLGRETYRDLRKRYKVYYAAKAHNEQRKVLQDMLKERAPTRLQKRLDKRKRL